MVRAFCTLPQPTYRQARRKATKGFWGSLRRTPSNNCSFCASGSSGFAACAKIPPTDLRRFLGRLLPKAGVSGAVARSLSASWPTLIKSWDISCWEREVSDTVKIFLLSRVKIKKLSNRHAVCFLVGGVYPSPANQAISDIASCCLPGRNTVLRFGKGQG